MRHFAIALLLLVGSVACGPSFQEETSSAGLEFAHGFESPFGDLTDHDLASGGVAAGDFDGDGFIDLYVVRGDVGSNLLFRNLGDGRFEEMAAAAGVATSAAITAGPVFVDYDGDGSLDLVVPGIDVPTIVFRGDGEGGFTDATLGSGLFVLRPAIAAAFGDYDRDGDLDAYVTHWATDASSGITQQLFQNRGAGTFVDATAASGIGATIPAGSEVHPTLDLTFAPSFSDIDDDGWPDLLVTGDFGTSQVLRNRRDGTFEDITPDEIDDENGMGSAIGDFDNDCDLDWFVTSIRGEEPPTDGLWGISGNRLYRNDGGGLFEDVSQPAGVRDGGWGWGACFADFDNDGLLDLFHTNGWYGGEGYLEDPSRLFLSNGDGTFREEAVELGIDDHAMGRGVSCFDAERDGDIDIFVANIDGPPAFYRNTARDAGEAAHHFLGVRLRGPAGNTQGVGSRIYIKTEEGVQMRQIEAASRFASQDPAEAHFGLGANARVLATLVVWPDGELSNLGPVGVDQLLTLSYEDGTVRGAGERLARTALGCRGD